MLYPARQPARCQPWCQRPRFDRQRRLALVSPKCWKDNARWRRPAGGICLGSWRSTNW